MSRKVGNVQKLSRRVRNAQKLPRRVRNAQILPRRVRNAQILPRRVRNVKILPRRVSAENRGLSSVLTFMSKKRLSFYPFGPKIIFFLLLQII